MKDMSKKPLFVSPANTICRPQLSLHADTQINKIVDFFKKVRVKLVWNHSLAALPQLINFA